MSIPLNSFKGLRALFRVRFPASLPVCLGMIGKNRKIKRRPSKSPFLPLLLTCAALLTATGCGYTQGQFLYLLGVGRGQLIKPEFTFTSEPVLVLVDDVGERVTYPPSKTHLAESVADALLNNKAAQKIVPEESLARLRQGDPDFVRHSGREIGELLGAEQVLWLEVQDYLVSEQIEDALAAARCTVSVKVLNVLEKKDRLRVRVYPSTPEGRVITATMTGSELVPLKTRERISRELMLRISESIAKLFYEHRLGDFEKPP